MISALWDLGSAVLVIVEIAFLALLVGRLRPIGGRRRLLRRPVSSLRLRMPAGHVHARSMWISYLVCAVGFGLYAGERETVGGVVSLIAALAILAFGAMALRGDQSAPAAAPTSAGLVAGLTTSGLMISLFIAIGGTVRWLRDGGETSPIWLVGSVVAGTGSWCWLAVRHRWRSRPWWSIRRPDRSPSVSLSDTEMLDLSAAPRIAGLAMAVAFSGVAAPTLLAVLGWNRSGSEPNATGLDLVSQLAIVGAFAYVLGHGITDRARAIRGDHRSWSGPGSPQPTE